MWLSNVSSLDLRIIKLFVCVLLIIYTESHSFSAVVDLKNLPPIIKNIQKVNRTSFQLNGDHFGSPCQGCEVIAEYTTGFKYSHAITFWSDKRIIVNIPDLSKGYFIKLSVHTLQNKSNQKPLRLNILKAYDRIHNNVMQTQAKGVITFDRQHNDSLGGKGIDTFSLSSIVPSCNKLSLVFDQAQLIYKMKRFSGATLKKTPKAGCAQCSPLLVQWLNEPTGKLEYQLQAYQREVQGICSDKIRQ